MAIGLLPLSIPLAAAASGSVPVIQEAPAPLPHIIYMSGTGKEQKFSPAAARLSVVHFWATWCIPCLKELPALDAAYGEYKGRGLAVLALAVEGAGPEKIQDFYKEHDITNLPVAFDAGSAGEISLKGLPTTLFVDAKGNIIARADGPVDWSSSETKAFLAQHLGP